MQAGVNGVAQAELTRAERETLKAVYRRAQHGPQVRTGDLAADLGLSPGTVTARVRRLADSGLVEHELYRGVTLTGPGRVAAVAAIRRHRIVERFLSDMLGYPWEDADRLAATFEHHLPDEVEERLFAALDRPATCPHGFPIPAPEAGDVPSLPTLRSLEPGDEAVVALPGSTDPEVATFLDTLGLRPDVRIVVRDKHPFDGPVLVLVDGQERAVGDRLARQIFVRPVRPGHRAPVDTGRPPDPDRREPA
ncbi:metal-dependent transcriptional regulator [soil metagenome]